jgi:hypothetical protein
MKTNFHIALNIKTATGFESIGKFSIGNNRAAAQDLFISLHGKEALQETDILHMDLVETNNGLPVSIRVISCTLEEIAVNCKIITKELFKLMNLDNEPIT